MKKCILVFLMVLVAVGLFADSNTDWNYLKDVNALTHTTSDTFTFEDEDGKEVEVGFLKGNDEDEICFIIYFGNDFYIDNVDYIVYAESIDNFKETGLVFEVDDCHDGGLALNEDDSYLLYKDALESRDQKVFILADDSGEEFRTAIVQVNFSKFYRYKNYLR